MTIDKEEQLAKIRKPLKPCANISVQFSPKRGGFMPTTPYMRSSYIALLFHI